MKPCDAARILLEVAKPGHGGAPGFKPAHALQALRILAGEPGSGRPRLQHLLGLGEAATRTLIARLMGAGLTAKANRGARLTRLGASVLEALTGSVHEEETPEPLIEEWGSTTMFLVRIKPPHSLTDVYIIRDYLVEEGCRQSVIGGLKEGALTLPGAPDYLARRLEQYIPPFFEGEATVVVVPSKCRVNALNAMLRLVAEQCN